MQQEIRRVVPTVGRGRAVVAGGGRADAVQAQETGARGEREPGGLRVGVPLPLQPELRPVERVGGLRHGDRSGAADAGFSIRENGLAGAVAVRVEADDGPVVMPGHGLEMHDAAEGAAVLEMKKPILAGGRVDPRALVGAVDGGAALREHDAMLVGAVEMFRAEDRLVAGRDTAGGREDIIVAVALVEFRAFERAPAGDFVGVDDDLARVQGLAAVGAEPAQRQEVGDARTALGPAVNEIELAVVVPEGAGIDQAPAGKDEFGRRPGAGGIGGGGEIDAEVGVRIRDPVFAGVIPQGRRPDTLAVPRPGKMIDGRLLGEDVVDDGPVDEICGVQDRQAGSGEETRRDQIEIVPDADRIGIRVVGEQHGVFIRAVAKIGNPRRGGRRSDSGMAGEHGAEGRSHGGEKEEAKGGTHRQREKDGDE